MIAGGTSSSPPLPPAAALPEKIASAVSRYGCRKGVRLRHIVTFPVYPWITYTEGYLWSPEPSYPGGVYTSSGRSCGSPSGFPLSNSLLITCSSIRPASSALHGNISTIVQLPAPASRAPPPPPAAPAPPYEPECALGSAIALPNAHSGSLGREPKSAFGLAGSR